MKSISVKPSKLFPDGTAILYIDSNDIDLEAVRVFADSKGLHEKDFFHLTVIGSRTADDLIKFLEKDLTLVSKINHLLEINHWKVRINSDKYYIEKVYERDLEEPETRQSIIQLVKIEGGENFYSEIEKLIGKKYKLPLPHITLFTNSSNPSKKLRGIGIYSEEEFRNLSPILINTPKHISQP